MPSHSNPERDLKLWVHHQLRIPDGTGHTVVGRWRMLKYHVVVTNGKYHAPVLYSGNTLTNSRTTYCLAELQTMGTRHTQQVMYCHEIACQMAVQYSMDEVKTNQAIEKAVARVCAGIEIDADFVGALVTGTKIMSMVQAVPLATKIQACYQPDFLWLDLAVAGTTGIVALVMVSVWGRSVCRRCVSHVLASGWFVVQILRSIVSRCSSRLARPL
jgi:hypothetical protein